MISKCSSCKEEKVIWHNKQCSECLEVDSLSREVLTLSLRRCRKCNKLLPKSRYFDCLKCKPALESIDEDYIYIGAHKEKIDEEISNVEMD